MEEETSLGIIYFDFVDVPSKVLLCVDANNNGAVDDGHHGMGDDIEDYMNDTSHIDNIEGLVSPPQEELQNSNIPEENGGATNYSANGEDPKEAAARRIQDVANKKKERDDAKKVVNDLRVKKAEETEKKYVTVTIETRLTNWMVEMMQPLRYKT